MFLGYCYKYTHATYHCFCGPGSQILIIISYLIIINIINNKQVQLNKLECCGKVHLFQ